jgi:hypothetical protein
MSWIGPLVSAGLGAVTGNIAAKGAAQNAQNAQNIGLARNVGAGATATGALNNYWSQNPFYKMQAPSAPGAVSGQGAPSMQAPAPTAAPAGQGQAGGPAPPGAQGGQAQGQIPPQLLAALKAAMAGRQGGQPGGQRPPGMQLPQSPQIAQPMQNPQALLQHIYGQH